MLIFEMSKLVCNIVFLYHAWAFYTIILMVQQNYFQICI